MSDLELTREQAGVGSTDDPGPSHGAGPDDSGTTAGDPRDPSFRRRRKEWRQTERARRFAARKSVRFPIFTRSVLLWMLIFALVGVAFGASGAFWWASFNTEVAELKDKVETFEQSSQEAIASIEQEKNAALEELNTTIAPLRGFLSETQLIQLSPVYAPFVYAVETQDEEGLASPATAFAVITNDNESFMLTSLAAVAANTVNPAPGITIVKGEERLQADLWAWDPANDLALLRVPKGGLPVLDWATEEVAQDALGSRVFPVSGLGGTGASLTSGVVIDQSLSGIRHNAEIGPEFRGAPMINVDGKVLAVATRDYEPLGFATAETHFAPPVNVACTTVLRCGGGTREAADRQEPGQAPPDPGVPSGAD